MDRSTRALAALLVPLALAAPVGAARIGFDDRNGQVAANHLASGSDFGELRALVTGLGHTLVALSSFESGDLTGANIQALYLSQPYFQSGGDFSAAEITAIHDFVDGGGGLVLHADGGAGFETASPDTLAGVYGVSFAATATQDDGHSVFLLDESHPVTAGVGVSDGLGYCLDFQRILSISAPAVDLSTLGAPTTPEDDAIAAVTGTGGAGNVVILSDTSGFKDPGVSFDVDIDCGDNRLLASNIVAFVVPEPGTLALCGLGLLPLARLARRRSRTGPPRATPRG